jgi:hypothetical protein
MSRPNLWDHQSNSCRGCGAVNDTPHLDDCPMSSNYQEPGERIAELEEQVSTLQESVERLERLARGLDHLLEARAGYTLAPDARGSAVKIGKGTIYVDGKPVGEATNIVMRDVPAFNRTPPGIPLDEWQRTRNAKKRARRALKGKR